MRVKLMFTSNVKTVHKTLHKNYMSSRQYNFLLNGQKCLHLAAGKDQHPYNRDPVDHWLTLTARLPTWGSQWFVSGMAELLSGRRAYVTEAADNTWVLSWGLGEWLGSLMDREVGAAHCARPLHHREGQRTAGTTDTPIVLVAFRLFME